MKFSQKIVEDVHNVLTKFQIDARSRKIKNQCFKFENRWRQLSGQMSKWTRMMVVFMLWQVRPISNIHHGGHDAMARHFEEKKMAPKSIFFEVPPPKKIVENSFVETKNGHAECSVT